MEVIEDDVDGHPTWVKMTAGVVVAAVAIRLTISFFRR